MLNLIRGALPSNRVILCTYFVRCKYFDLSLIRMVDVFLIMVGNGGKFYYFIHTDTDTMTMIASHDEVRYLMPLICKSLLEL